MLIGVIGWVVLGMIAGFIASKFVNLRGDDPKLGIIFGGGGGLVGGWLYSWISGSPVSGFNVMSLMLALIGACVVLVSWHSWRRIATN